MLLTAIGAAAKPSGQPMAEPHLLPADSAVMAAETITGTYTPWKQVTLTGKLRIDGLFLTPSYKMYMKKGERIVLSIRVPLMGEVGTLEVDKKKFTLVNKVKKTYVMQDISSLMADLPVTLGDLQDIFLGRIFLPDSGTLSMENSDEAEFYTVPGEEGWLVLPLRQPVEYEVNCGYTTLPDGRTSNILVTTLDCCQQAEAEYTYKKNETEISLRVRRNSKDRDFGLTVKDPDFNGRPVTPAKVDKDYRQVSLRDFFKNLI